MKHRYAVHYRLEGFVEVDAESPDIAVDLADEFIPMFSDITRVEREDYDENDERV